MSHALHDPTIERDACGIGLVADARGRASRELVDRALAGLAAVSHRGAWAADGVTGDGAGVLLPLQQALTGIEGAGLAMCFLREPWLRGIVEEACRAEGLEPFGWRDVPTDVAALGSTATASMPRIAQLVLAPCAEPDAELRAHRARRRAERVEGVYVASLSFRTVTYKALCAATHLASFYPDLADPTWAASWAIFHQRFSTNTEPSWERAQPFRFLCHNGEINTIDGNVAWMEARERARGVDPDLAPALDTSGSDSALLDNALELLVRAGLDVREAVTLLVPPAWQNDPRIDERQRAMHRYHAMLAEPWDGPAGLVFSDGVVCGAALDRNGLRPLRVAVCEDGLVAVSSEAGAIPLPEGVAVRRARLGPGQLLSLDPDRGLLFDGELKRVLASRKPYAAWVDESVRFAEQGEPLPASGGRPRRASRAPRLHARGALAHAAADRADGPGPRLLDGRRRPDRAARGTGAAARVVLPAALRTGDEPRDRPLPRADGHVRRDPRRRSRAARRGGRAAAARRPALVPRHAGRPRGTRPGRDRRDVHRRRRARRRGRARRRPGRRPRRGRLDRRSVSPMLRRAGERAPVPSLLAVAAAHGRLVERGLRTTCSLLVSSDDTRDTHMVATLVGYGADVVCPRLALETVARLADTDKVGGDRPTPAEAQARLLRALEDGVLKVMSKVGISDVASYRGARLFEAVGLDRRLCKRFFGGTPSAIGGISLDALEARRARAARGELGGEAGAREPGLLQVPQGRRAARDRSGRRRGAPGRASPRRTRS